MIGLGAASGAAALLLVYAGVRHLIAPAELVGVTRGAALAGAVAAAELAVGSVTALALLLGGALLPWALLAQAVVYAAFAVNLTRRVRRGDGGPCGCGGPRTRVGPAGVARAATLAVVCAAAALIPGDVAWPAVADDAAGVALLGAAGVVLAVLLHNLPAAIDGQPVGRIA